MAKIYKRLQGFTRGFYLHVIKVVDNKLANELLEVLLTS